MARRAERNIQTNAGAMDPTTLILIALMVLAFYFLMMRPQRKRQQALAQLLSELTPGTRVMLGSGLFGTVLSVGEKQVVLEISPGAELTVLKQAVARVVTEDDEDVEVEDVQPEQTATTDPDVEPPTTGQDPKPTSAG